jgi:hypothetical protein
LLARQTLTLDGKQAKLQKRLAKLAAEPPVGSAKEK